jgi:putative intracellular protease/amidase
MSKRVLIVVTSHARMGDTDTQTGIWLEELAVPYYRFVDAGVAVEIASPRGGAAPLEPKSLGSQVRNDPAVDRFLADPVAQRRVAATLPLAAVDAAAFDAVFLPGGHGTMWDLPVDAGVQRAVEQAEAAGRVIAAVCHGPAGLVTARRADGEPLVAGKRVTAFTNAEEDAVGLTTVVPFLLESRLRELGADFVSGPNWLSLAVRDGRLITGQNPASSAAVADHVMTAITEARYHDA